MLFKMKIILNTLLVLISVGFATTNESLAGYSFAESPGKLSLGTDFAYIDVHNHISGGPPRRADYFGAARNALSGMDEMGIKKLLLCLRLFRPATGVYSK